MMESKGIQYSVALNSARWVWIVHLKDGLQTGSAPNRTLAVLAAIKAINKAAKKQRAVARSASKQASPNQVREPNRMERSR
jgi:hypothetical protein